MLVDFIGDWKYLDAWPFLAPFESGFGFFQKLPLRITLSTPNDSHSVTPQADYPVFTAVAISEQFPFLSLSPHFQSELCIWP